MSVTSAYAPSSNLVTAAAGTEKWSVVGKWMTYINPEAKKRARGQSVILLLNYTSCHGTTP